MKISKIRFKRRFLKRLEVKLAHLVFLLLSKTLQNRTDGKKRKWESFLFHYSHTKILLLNSNSNESHRVWATSLFPYLSLFFKNGFSPLSGDYKHQIHMSYIQPNFGFLPKLKELWHHGCPVQFGNNSNYMSLFVIECEKLPVNDEIRASCQANLSPKHYIKRYKQQKWTLKNC